MTSVCLFPPLHFSSVQLIILVHIKFTIFIGIIAGLMFHFGSRLSHRSQWSSVLANNNNFRIPAEAQFQNVEQQEVYQPPEVIITKVYVYLLLHVCIFIQDIFY